MWEPGPGWTPLRRGTASAGVWVATEGRREYVVKRLSRPGPGDPAYLSDERHPAYWRREAEVASSGAVTETVGLRARPSLRVEEDDDGVTLSEERIEPASGNGLHLARALGRFATCGTPRVPWLAHGVLRTRLTLADERGGWPLLARTTLADVADLLWTRRTAYLDRCDRLPQVLSHGDPTTGNLLGRQGDDVLAVDWSVLGLGPVGSDLGYLALSVREDFEALLTAYVDGWGGPVDEARLGAAVMVTYTALSLADWALARVAPGEGALAAKFTHPSVAPYLRALQRLLPVLETLTE